MGTIQLRHGDVLNFLKNRTWYNVDIEKILYEYSYKNICKRQM